MKFDPFVIPFSFGLLFILTYLLVYLLQIIMQLSKEERNLLFRHVFSGKVFSSVFEIFMQCLVHERIWKKNRLTGYMHMSFALGWFLLIVFGNLESRYISKAHINPPYFPIFLKFFIHDKAKLYFEFTTVPGFFRFIMDFLLLFVLSGLVLALLKRIRSRWFGYKVKVEHRLLDRVALISLWLIFPFRLLAESFTAGLRDGGGGFLTGGLGFFFRNVLELPLQYMVYPAWWAYSLALGFFFVSMPWSRYMHIPAEAIFIVLKNAGISLTHEGHPMQKLSLLACSSCGMCTQVCQLRYQAMVADTGSARFVAAFRYGEMSEELADKCLLCLRCSNICPVALPLEQLRYAARTQYRRQPFYAFPSGEKSQKIPQVKSVLYFSGCMTTLQPSVIQSLSLIFDQAGGVNFQHLDAERHLCCGRPALLAGYTEKAVQMRNELSWAIQEAGGELLVVSCPICLKTLQNDFSLPIPVVHHSIFIAAYLDRLHLERTSDRYFYHDPCELGRGLGIFEEPRQILRCTGHLLSVSDEKSGSLCCGGSLAALSVSTDQMEKVTRKTLQQIPSDADYLVTACPRCRNTFTQFSPIPVKDVAEIAAQALKHTSVLTSESKKMVSV